MPSRVEYKLTTFGESFRPVMKSLYAWGDAYRALPLDARESLIRT